MTRNVLKPLASIRVALAVAAGLPLFYTSNAWAQDAAPSPAAGAGAQAEVERVIVTGSNIPTAEEVGPNPVDTYRKEDITRLGVRSASDLIHKLPASTGSQVNENNTNGGNGRAEINLRGILAKETLVLQDGRRLVGGIIAPSNGTVDINTVPIGLIDHVEILKDGASAIYGSDAVSGVFNVLLTHRFRGLEVQASYGNSNLGFAGDGAEETAYLLAGTGTTRAISWSLPSGTIERGSFRRMRIFPEIRTRPIGAAQIRAAATLPVRSVPLVLVVRSTVCEHAVTITCQTKTGTR